MAIHARCSLLLALLSLSILEFSPASQAALVKFTLDIHYFPGSPDGVHKDKILGINGQFPGPLLEANVGDTLEITVTNSIQDGQNTSLHWHGIHQKGSYFEDGAAMISQCPLPQGQSMVYRFNATQPGTFWYHSHVGSQYTEGMLGPMIVHGTPEAYTYDGEFTLLLSDWYHQTASENEKWHLSPGAFGVPPYPNSGLINGMGRYPCEYAELMNRTCDTNLQRRPVFRVQRNKVYRMRVLDVAAVAGFDISVDFHQLHAIEADGIDVAKPVTADNVPLASGQRYSLLIQCRDDDTKNVSRYLIRANLRKESLMLIHEEHRKNINIYPEALWENVTAVLECVDEDLSHLPNLVEVTSEPFTYLDVVPPYYEEMEDIDEMALSPLDGIAAPNYFDKEFVLEADFYEDHEDIRRGSFNRTPFGLPDDKPLILKLKDGEQIPEISCPLEINYGDVIQVVINNPFFGPHPFHLHGHHFWILGMGGWADGNYSSTQHNLTIHGVKRDTVLVQEQSWAVIRFVADNPGVWIFHCHIDWHVLTGMALTFVEGADIIRNSTEVPDEVTRVCRMHNDFNSSNYNKISQKDMSTILHPHFHH